MNAEAQKKFDETLAEAARQYNIAHEKFTEKQLMEAFRQAILCGDFIRYVVESGDAQQIVYIPFAREGELLSRIHALEEQLRLSHTLECDHTCELCGEP